MTPQELMHAILPGDLLERRIGTYVKGLAETHADAGDKTNDPIRVNGAELRCRVSARAETSASPRPAASSTPATAAGSTPTSSTTRPADTPTTR